MDERTENQRIGDLEAWAFRAGRDLAEIKGELKGKSTVAAVDALHQDVRELREEMRHGFDRLTGRLDGVDGRLGSLGGDLAGLKAEQAAQRRLLEQILGRLPGA